MYLTDIGTCKTLIFENSFSLSCYKPSTSQMATRATFPEKGQEKMTSGTTERMRVGCHVTSDQYQLTKEDIGRFLQDSSKV